MTAMKIGDLARKAGVGVRAHRAAGKAENFSVIGDVRDIYPFP